MSQNNENQPPFTDPTKELAAMSKVSEALQGLSKKEVERVLTWLSSVYEIGSTPQTITTSAQQETPGVSTKSSELASGNDNHINFQAFHELFDAAYPKDNAERALVAGYWLQEQEQQDNFDGYSVNKILKNLGHPVSNVTNAFSALMTRKPRHAMQVSKAGKSKQSKKLYKLTIEGIKAVKKMISNENNGE